MNICKQKYFGPVTAWELGFGPLGKPFMTTHFYLLDTLLIDTGCSHVGHEVEKIINNINVSRVLLTHHHEDHSGNAAAIKKIKNVPVYGHPKTIEKMRKGFKIMPYQHIIWGVAQPLEVNLLSPKIETDKYALEPIHAPGHSADHMVYYEKNMGWLFSGDIFLASKIKYFRADEKFDDSLRSIKMILKLDFDALFCDHNPQPKNGKPALRSKLDYLENFRGEVEKLIEAGYDEASIIKSMAKREATQVKWFTFGNVSYANMIREAYHSIKKNEN